MQSLQLAYTDGQVVRWADLPRAPAPGSGDTPAHTQSRLLPLTGIAWGGGSGAGIGRVEVSVDGGATWCMATLLHSERPQDDTSRGKDWAWVRWQAQVAVGEPTQQPDKVCVMVRCVDGQGNPQPRTKALHPRLRGNGDGGGAGGGAYLFNGWHATTIHLA